MALARGVTEVLAPVHLVAVLLLVVGVHAAGDPVTGLAWGCVALLFAGAMPYAFLLLGVRAGRYTGRHLPVRTQRFVPLAAGALSVSVGVAVLALLGAPRELTALVVAMLAGLLVTLAVTVFWKISVHTAVGAGTATVLTLVLGAAGAAAWPAVALIGWSRLVLAAHTPAQVAVAVPVGAVVAFAVFTSLR